MSEFERWLRSDELDDFTVDEMPLPPGPSPGKLSMSRRLPIQRRAQPRRQAAAPAPAPAAGAITHEVTVHTVQLILDPRQPPPDRIIEAFAYANQIFNPVGLRVVRGAHQMVSGTRAQGLLRREQDDIARQRPDMGPLTRQQVESNATNLDYADSLATPEQGPRASQEAIEIAGINRHPGEPTAYWVPGIATGNAITVDSVFRNLPADRESIFLGQSAGGEVFAHELGHLLMDIGHTDLDGSDDDGNGVADEEIVDTDNDNLMQDGSRRTGTDLTPAQIQRLLGSEYVHRVGEPPNRGLGRRLASPVQRAAAADAGAVREPVIGAGAPLPPPLLADMEASFGADFSAVRVQESSEADAVGARAFTRASDIVFAPGTYDPDSTAGRELIGHELTHVVQQAQGRVSAPQADGGFINADPALEAEADALGARAARGEVVGHEPARANPSSGGTVQRQPSITEDHLRRDLLARGVSEDELGNLAALARWPDARITHAMRILDALRAGGGRRGAGAREASEGRRAYAGRIVAAWNRHLDDLGAGDPWPTILHFVDHIEDLARQQGFPATVDGSHYLTAIREENMPTVRLAGAAVGVNPRNVYFAAAAQLTMDRDGGTDAQREEAGHGHWVPAGGFRDMARDMTRSLRSMGFLGRRERTTGVPEGGAILAAIRADLDRMHEALQAQDEERDIRGYGAHEHREPEMRAWMQAQWAQINAVPRGVSDADSAAAARQLLTAMGTVPGGGDIHHGYGSIDPHGTDHAMGNAIDIYNGRGGGGTFQNFGVRGEYWPFVHYLIQEHGSSYGLDPSVTPSSIHQLPPAQAQALATLIRERGPTEYQLLRSEDEARRAAARTAEADPEAARAAREQRQSLRSIRQRVRLALQHRSAAVWRTRGPRVTRYYPDELVDRIAREHHQLREDIPHVEDMGPQQMIEVLRRHDTELTEIDLACDSVEAEADASALADQAAEYDDIESDRSEAIEASELQHDQDLQRIWNNRLELTEQLRTTEAALPSATGRERGRLTRRRSLLRRRLSQLEGSIAAADRSAERREAGIERRAGARERTADRTASRAADRRHSAGDIMEGITPDPEPFDALITELEAHGESLGEAFEADRTESMSAFIRTRAFEQWLLMVSDPDRPIYDQPETMVDALNDVHSHGDGDDTHFYGGHHWTVAPRENLTNDTAYQSSLEGDMAHRSPADLERILCIMAESAGGRRILFDSPDPELHRALENTLGEGARTVLANVHARVVAPLESEGGSESERTSLSIRRSLRERGHYIAE